MKLAQSQATRALGKKLVRIKTKREKRNIAMQSFDTIQSGYFTLLADADFK